MDGGEGGTQRAGMEMMEVIGSEQGILGRGSFEVRRGFLEGVVDGSSYGRVCGWGRR